jgi:hypothetical protein
LAGVGLALAGIAAAVTIGLLANSISGDSVGLSAEPLSAGDALAPRAAGRSEPRRERRPDCAERRQTGRGAAPAPTRTPPATPPPSDTAPPATSDDGGGGDVVEPGDDDGGGGRGRGRGRSGGDSGSDGSGFDDSGSGSDDSGSDDSGSGGHGSDD